MSDKVSDKIEEKFHPALVHARHLVAPGTGEPGRPLLVGFHGYGENARAHLDELLQIPGHEEWVVASIEAPHPFYTKAGDVVGCWMTRQGRELAIDDNVGYVASVIGELKRSYQTSPILVFSGFSQGVAMTYRAALRCGFPCHGVIALAGDVPPEVAAAGWASFPPVLVGRGTQDSWYSQAKMDSDLATLDRLGARVSTCVTEAGHVWTKEFRRAAGDFLKSIAAR